MANPTVNSASGRRTFRYTLDGEAKVSAAEREFYEDNGYLLVRSLVPAAELDRYLARFKDICSGLVPKNEMTVMRDVAIAKSEFVASEHAITKLQDFVHDDVLFDYCGLPGILELVKSFCGQDVRAMHTMLINKPPDPGTMTSRHPMHQDLHYFNFRPADRIVCAWTAMEEINEQNGCLVVVPGSHKGDLLPHTYPNWPGGVNKMYHGIQGYDPNTPRLHLRMNRGDTVFFHPLLVHGSGMNRSQGFRKAISCHYASSHCYYIDVRGTSQDDLWQEIKEVAERRLGKHLADQISFADVWRLRSRIVSGVEATL